MRVPCELVVIIDYIIVDNEISAYDQETVVRSANLPRNPGSRILSWGTPPLTRRIMDFGAEAVGVISDRSPTTKPLYGS